MYILVYSLLKDKLSALLSSLLYLWLPYHFLIIYVGASIGTAFIFTFLPLIFLGIYLSGEKSKWGVVILTFSLTGVILSQVMNLAFLLPAIFIFTLWRLLSTSLKKLLIKNILFGIMLSVLISAFYLLPATFYKQATRFHTERGIGKIYERNFLNFKQLIYSKWGFSPIINNAKNEEISFQLGFAQWASVALILLLLAQKKVLKTYKSLSVYLLLGFITSIFFTNDLSKPVWDLIVNLAAVDFPFRLVLPAAFTASILSGVALISFKGKVKLIVFIMLTMTALYTNRNHINVNEYTNLPVSTYLGMETEITTNTYHEYLPIQATSKLFEKPWNEIVGENLTVTKVKQTTNLLSFNVVAQAAQKVSLGQLYFPGQTLYVDKVINKFETDKQGRISFTLTEGVHQIMVKYQDTTLVKISKLLSMLGLVIFLSIILWHKKQYFYRKK